MPFSELPGGTMNFPIANRNPRETNRLAVIFGALAMLYAWTVIYPSRHSGFTGSPPLVVFEVTKAIALLLILGKVYMLNREEVDQTARSQNIYMFTVAAGVSVLIDIGISLFKL
jgi:hypothetical protein